MGEQNNTTSYMMMQGSDGEWQKVELLDFPDLMENYSNNVPTDGELGDGIKYHLTPTEAEGRFTATIKYPKQMRCESRKRYVKLLMSRGVERNLAEAITKYRRCVKQLCGYYFSYQSEWFHDYWIFKNGTEATNVH